MPLPVLIILLSVVFVLAVALYLVVKLIRAHRHITEHLTESDTWSCRCKVCNTHIAFDSTKPLPKIWLCPACGSKNYTQPKPDNNY